MKRFIIPVVILLLALLCALYNSNLGSGHSESLSPAAIIGFSGSISAAGTLGNLLYKKRRPK